jgi:hypothetical protein
MIRAWKSVRWASLLIGLAAGVFLGAGLSQPLFGTGRQEPAAGKAARYTVVFTEGHNLGVTDNQVNTLYFYTVDPGAEPGADLKLRATVDLSQVGKEVLHPRLLKKKR